MPGHNLSKSKAGGGHFLARIHLKRQIDELHQGKSNSTIVPELLHQQALNHSDSEQQLGKLSFFLLENKYTTWNGFEANCAISRFLSG